MYETDQELADLQALLDRSYERSGAHLREIFAPGLRLAAREVADTLSGGMQLLSLATVTRANEPRIGTVDGLFFHGHFWFGSSPESVRFRHIRQRPQVSASHIRGEDLSVVVHGRAYITTTTEQLRAGDQPEFARYLIEVYGQQWLEWAAPDGPLSGACYARIEPEIMFASRLPGAG